MHPRQVRLTAGMIALGACAAIALLPATTPAWAQDAATLASGPQPVSGLAEGLLDAVVNISITQDVKPEGDEGSPVGEIPEGAPFADEFKDFFDGKGGDNSANKVTSLGSGFVIDPDGTIVTNNHVVEGATTIEVIFADGTKLRAKLLGVDTKTDLAVLKVEAGKTLKAVPFGDSRKVRIGDWVMAIGNPFGLGGSVSLGIISARNRNINAGPYDNFIQTDAAINRGNSGGPLFNMKGEVIGINTAIISPTGGSIGIGFAVPTEIAENVVRQLKAFGETRRGWLGIRVQPVTDDMISTLKLDKAKGALVSGVIPGGPVSKGELKTGDVILSFNGQEIGEMRDLPRIVAESPISQPLLAKVLRDGKVIDVMLTLERAKDDGTKADAKDEAKTPDDTAEPGAEPDQEATPPADDQQPSDSPSQDELLGLSLATLDGEAKKTYGIATDVEGVVITDVKPSSPAAEKGLVKGDVIVEIAQEFVATPDDVAAKINQLKESDRRNAYMMIANTKGDLRLVAIPID